MPVIDKRGGGTAFGYPGEHPELAQAAGYLRAGKPTLAEPPLRCVHKKLPNDVSSIRLLADIEIRAKRHDNAKKLLQRCIKLAPEYALARSNYIVLLLRRHQVKEALGHVNLLLAKDPKNPKYLFLKGSILVRWGDHPAAIGLFENVLKSKPRWARAQLSYGHALKAAGRVDQAIAAYRRAIDVDLAVGEAYWSLANLKTFRFNDADIAAMRIAISLTRNDAKDQTHLAFAMAKALEDRQLYEGSFEYYQRGNAIRHAKHHYNSSKKSADAVRHIHTQTTDFFAQRRDWGCHCADPIFIVGLPRAGSSLLEQILASHYAVNGTGERPDIIAISQKLGRQRKGAPGTQYPEVLAKLSRQQCAQLGQSYLSSTKSQRGRSPFFVDKMPNNFLHIGLIHLILPNAKIIDARRHPMAGCFANYKQLYAQGQTFTYDLKDLGHYYRHYVKVMDHWDKVLPGKVLRVQYEEMVNHPEVQIRRLLNYCGLSFEHPCLRFYDTKRIVLTPSSEQVRQPIYTQGLEQWRHYEKHLSPLKEALGPLLQRYPIPRQSTL